VIETIQDDIVTQLLTITGIGTVDAWQGDIEDMEEILKISQKLPALHVIYHGSGFGEKKTIGANRADNRMRFMIVLVNKNAKSRAAGAASSYTIIEAVRSKLMGHKTSPYQGFLWPLKEDLLLALGGIQVYGLIYFMDTGVTV
jgi:phage gp37-like protein